MQECAFFLGGFAQPRLQRTAAAPLAEAGTICKVGSELAVVVVQSPPLPLSHTLGRRVRDLVYRSACI